MDAVNALVSPCAKSIGYFKYVLASAVILCAFGLLSGGFIASGLVLSLSGVFIVASNILTGLLAGWLGVFAFSLGFVVTLVNGIKGVLAFYSAGQFVL
jgi:hypothetical protein